MMRRRLVLSVGVALALTGCGFQLRGAPDLAFKSIYINAEENSPIGNELKRSLASLPTLNLITDAAAQASAEVVLDILSEAREKSVVGMNTSGQVTEFQLRSRLQFRLRRPKGKELIGSTELVLHRDVSFNESAVLAKEAEEGLMYRDMQSDIVQQLIRRLAAVKTL